MTDLQKLVDHLNSTVDYAQFQPPWAFSYFGPDDVELSFMGIVIDHEDTESILSFLQSIVSVCNASIAELTQYPYRPSIEMYDCDGLNGSMFIDDVYLCEHDVDLPEDSWVDMDEDEESQND